MCLIEIVMGKWQSLGLLFSSTFGCKIMDNLTSVFEHYTIAIEFILLYYGV